MKHLLSILLLATLFCSCSKDEEETHLIKYVVQSNTDSTLHIYFPKDTIVKKYWEYEELIHFDAKSNIFSIKCGCNDPNTVMTGEIYVDGKQGGKNSDNTYLQVFYELK